MHYLYRILGLTANLTERASRTSGNGVPVNWLIIVLLGFFAAMAIHEAIEVKVNEGDPIKTTIGQATSGDELLDRYIIVHGQFHPEESLVETENGKPKNDHISWIPLVDPEKRTCMFVKTDTSAPNRGVISRIEGSQSSFAAAPLVSVSGMLRKVPTDLSTSIRTAANPIAGIPPSPNYMLAAGTKPSGFILWVALSAALGLPILLMLLVISKRYVIFRPHSAPSGGVDLRTVAPAADPQAQPEIFVTARFLLNDKTRRLFHRVRAVVAPQDNGDVALLANVDASSRFMGSVTKNLSGIWAAVIRNETLSQPQYGTLYFGRTYPAFRIRYTDAIKSKPATAIIGANTPADLEKVRQAVYEPVYEPPPANPASPAPAPATTQGVL